MKDDLKQIAAELWQEQKGSSAGLITGLAIGAAILLFGFFNTLFVVICGVIGLVIGLKVDQGFDFLKYAEKFLPEKFRH